MDSLRLGDSDRESAVDQLAEQYSLGRLTRTEFDERSDAVWSAKTQGDLIPVFADLPATRPPLRAHEGGGRPRYARRWLPVPLVPVLFLLIALTVLTHLPFVLIAVGIWLFLGHGHWHANDGRRSSSC